MGEDLIQIPLAPPGGYATKDSHEQHNDGKQANLVTHDTNKGKMPMYCYEEDGAKVDEGWPITEYIQLGGKQNGNGSTEGSISPSEVTVAGSALKSNSKRLLLLVYFNRLICFLIKYLP